MPAQKVQSTRSNSSESSTALLSIARVERAIEAHYAIVELSRDLRLQPEQRILEQIASQRENEIAVRQRLPMRQRKLLDERSKLLEAHYAAAIPLDRLKAEQDRIGGELDRIEQRPSATELESDAIEANLKRALDFVGAPEAAYLAADHRIRRLMNRAIFERFLVDDNEHVIGDFATPFKHLIAASQALATRARVRAGQNEEMLGDFRRTSQIAHGSTSGAARMIRVVTGVLTFAACRLRGVGTVVPRQAAAQASVRAER